MERACYESDVLFLRKLAAVKLEWKSYLLGLGCIGSSFGGRRGTLL